MKEIYITNILVMDVTQEKKENMSFINRYSNEHLLELEELSQNLK